MNKRTLEKYKLPLYIFLFMISTDSAIVSINNSRVWARVSWVFIVGCLFFFGLINRKQSKRGLLYACIFSISLLLTMFIEDGGFDVNYFQRIILIFSVIFSVQYFEYEEFMEAFVDLMRFICVFSLIGVLMHDIVCNISWFPEFYSGDHVYKFLLFTNIPHYSMRNWGPVWEPGAFQIYVNFALLYQIRNKKNLKMADIVLFAITVVSTKSTAGIILLALILLYFIFFAQYESNIQKIRWMKISMLIVGAIGGGYLLTSSSFINQVFGKILAFVENMDTMNSANVSAYVRFKGIVGNLELFIEKPLFGWGIDGIQNVFGNRYGFTSNTCTVLAVASTYGVVPFCMYNYLWLKAMLMEKRLVDGLMLGISFVISLFNENMLVSFLFWMILVYESDILNKRRG